jgi:hypothetical protein
LDARELQQRLRMNLGWRVGDQTAAYILDKLLRSTDDKPFPIFASDARTGEPLHRDLDPSLLHDAQ